MALDTSIYNNIQAPQMPDAMGAATKAMTLSQLGMQNQQMQLQLQTQQAMRQAYQNNRNPDGSMNREGMLSDLGRVNPQAAMEMQQHFVAQDKARAEAQTEQAKAAQARLAVGLPVLQDLLTNVPQDQRSKVYPTYIKQLADQGVDLSQVLPPQYDEGAVKHLYVTGLGQQSAIENRLKQMQTSEAQAGIGEKQSATAKNYAEAAKAQSETYSRNPTMLGQTDDPAKLVPNFVPKDHQAKAFEEIKDAKNLKALTPQILAAFDKGSSRNPIIAAQGQREFEGLINTTVKDTEGTARQAAFDSIHKTMTPSGLTATPGENETKRRTVLEYLQSKRAAPTAGGYGIDLTKFDSTSPYQDKPKKVASTRGGSGSGLESTAQAAAPKIRPGTVEGGYVFMGGDPGNPKSWKRAK